MNRKAQLGTLAVVLAGLFGLLMPDYTIEEELEEDIVVSNVNRQSRKIVAREFKFVEVFPEDGLGTYGVCPLPNWLLQSENFGTSWVAGSGAIAAPTITLDQAADPETGLMTADRIQIPASPAGWSSVYQTGIPCFNNVCTFSFKIKGNGLSGTMDIAIGAGTPSSWSTCNYTNGVWSTCSHTAFGSSVWLGNITTWTGVARYNHDVFITRAMYNSSSTIANIYSKTTTVATAPQATTVKGDTLLVTRGSLAYCNANTDATGNTYTDGSLIMYPSNHARVERGADSVLGVRGEHAMSNDITQPDSLDLAPWTTIGTAMTITPDYARAPIGTQVAERLQIPATSGTGTSLRAVTGLTSGVRSGSCMVKGNGTSGSLDMYQSGASLSCGGCVYNPTTWTRCSISSTAAVTTFHIGNDSLDCGGGARGAADVLITNCQSEIGPYPTSFIYSGITRNNDVVQLDMGATAPGANNMCMKATISGKPVTAYEGYLAALNAASDSMGSTGGKGMWLYSNSGYGTTMRCTAMSDTSTVFTASSVAGGSGTVGGSCDISANTVIGSWAGNNMTASGALSGTFSPARYLTISGQSLGNYDAIKSRIVVDYAGKCN